MNLIYDRFHCVPTRVKQPKRIRHSLNYGKSTLVYYFSKNVWLNSPGIIRLNDTSLPTEKKGELSPRWLSVPCLPNKLFRILVRLRHNNVKFQTSFVNSKYLSRKNS